MFKTSTTLKRVTSKEVYKRKRLPIFTSHA